MGTVAAAAAASVLGCRLPLSDRRVRRAMDSSGSCASRACFTAGRNGGRDVKEGTTLVRQGEVSGQAGREIGT